MSCTEDAVNPTNPNAPEVKVQETINEQLEGTWSETSLTVTPAVTIGDYTTTNPYELKDDCEKDNLLVLKAGNRLEMDMGALSCDQDPMVSAPGAWEVHEDRNELILNGKKYQIEELNENDIKLSYVETMDQVKYTFTTTFARK